MANNADFINILRQIRGSAAPGQPATDGIWYELTLADKNGNQGIYGDILAKYGIVTESAGTFDQAVAILENLNVNITTLAPGEQATSALVNGVWQIGIPAGSDGADGVSGFTPALAMAYESGQLKYTVTVNGIEVTDATILDLQGLINDRIAAHVDIQATQDAKQEVIDAIADAQTLAGSIGVSVNTGISQLTAHTVTQKAELDTKSDALKDTLTTHATEKVTAYDANALDRVEEYNLNAATKVAEYNANDVTKLAQYNSNHVERLDEINTAYAGRIVDMLNTKRLLGMVDQFIVQTATQMATFMSTEEGAYIYYVNGVLLTEGVDYTVFDNTRIELTNPVYPNDVVIQIDTDVLGDMISAQDILGREDIGVANGVAGLDDNGLVPSEQLPSYVDDVLEVETKADLPPQGEKGKIYVVVSDESSNNDTSSYRWTGTTFAIVSNTLNTGDVKTLYENNPDTNAFTDAEKVKLANTEISSELDLRDTANRNTDNHTDGLINGVYTLAERSKLNDIEYGATADQTGSEIKALYEVELKAYTDAKDDKLALSTVLTTVSSTVTGAINELEGLVNTHIASTGEDHSYIDQDVTTTATPTFAGIITDGLVDGRDVSADGTKLDGIEAGATGDQTASEIEALYEGITDTNKYTDAEKSKLAGIEAGATGDQTGAEIKALYEAEANTNALTDANKTAVEDTLPTGISNVASNLSTHEGSTSVHGVGTVVGTTEVQTLTGKTIDSDLNWVGANHVHYKVKATQDMVAGTVVMGVGYNSGEDAFEVAKWTVASGNPALGMLQDSLTAGAFGLIVQSGQVKDIDTSILTVGTIYYPADGGLLTDTKPASGVYQAAVYVLRSHSSQGAVTVNFAEPVDNRASSVLVTAQGNLVATTVQSALEELQGDIDTLNGKDISITLTGDVTGTGTITNLGGVSFATTIAADSVALGTDTTGDYVAGLTAGTGISVSANGEGVTSTVTNTAPNVTTDISITHNASTVVVESSDGTDGTINAATSSVAGVMSAADKVSLDKTVVDTSAVYIDRADKYLAAQAVANMVYTDAKLTKVQYNNATDVEYEVLVYTDGKLTSVQHYIDSTLRGTTTLSYATEELFGGKLVSAIYVGV